LRVEPAATDLAALVANAAAMLHTRFPARRVQVDTPSALPPAWVDGRRIAQVLGNLLENAARYSREDGPIVVEVAPAPGTLRVTVRDHGPGIPPADLPFIFDKFYRAPNGARQEGGTGLGLTIARGIVEAHGGCLHAENLPGAGAAFHFTVPVARPS
jgi:signal transduction histidine kinase